MSREVYSGIAYDKLLDGKSNVYFLARYDNRAFAITCTHKVIVSNANTVHLNFPASYNIEQVWGEVVRYLHEYRVDTREECELVLRMVREIVTASVNLVGVVTGNWDFYINTNREGMRSVHDE